MKRSAATLVAVDAAVAALLLLGALPSLRSAALTWSEDLAGDFTPELPFKRVVVGRWLRFTSGERDAASLKVEFRAQLATKSRERGILR